LSDKAIGFSYFDNDISSDLKIKTVKTLTSNYGSDETMKKVSIKPHEVSSLVTNNLNRVVTKNKKIFFDLFGVDTYFLHDEMEERILILLMIRPKEE
jgi:hypothetical protein